MAISGISSAEFPFSVEKTCGGKPRNDLVMRRIWAGPYHERHRLSVIYGIPGTARRADGPVPFYEATVLQSVPTQVLIEVWGVSVDPYLYERRFQLLDEPPFGHYSLQNHNDRVSITLTCTSSQTVKIFEEEHPSRLIVELTPAQHKGALKQYYMLELPQPEVDGSIAARAMMGAGFRSGWFRLFNRKEEEYLLYAAGLTKSEKNMAIHALRGEGFNASMLRLYLPPENPSSLSFSDYSNLP